MIDCSDQSAGLRKKTVLTCVLFTTWSPRYSPCLSTHLDLYHFSPIAQPLNVPYQVLHIDIVPQHVLHLPHQVASSVLLLNPVMSLISYPYLLSALPHFRSQALRGKISSASCWRNLACMGSPTHYLGRLVTKL